MTARFSHPSGTNAHRPRPPTARSGHQLLLLSKALEAGTGFAAADSVHKRLYASEILEVFFDLFAVRGLRAPGQVLGKISASAFEVSKLKQNQAAIPVMFAGIRICHKHH